MANNRKWDALRGGIGFYATMAVCLAAVGVCGYFALFDRSEEPVPTPETPPVQEHPAVSPAEIAVPRDEQTAEKPTAAEEIVETAKPLPLPEVDDTPVIAQPPRQVMEPLRGEVVAAFSVDELLYNETLADWRIHDGVDIAAAEGAEVLAACGGTVAEVYDDALMGTTVLVDHDDGYRTMYANLAPEPPVSPGERVSAGQVVGTVGTTAAAERARGPHLHFSVTREGDTVNPHEFLK